MIDIVRNKTDDVVSILENVGYFLINEQQKHEYKTYKKEDGSLLTDLDIASEALIKQELKSLFGDIKIISEENSDNENVKITKEKCYFLLDPIDGTSSFDKGKEFTINLSFCVDQTPIIGFIHNPIKKTLLFGDKYKSFKKYGGKIQQLQKIKQNDKYDLIVNQQKQQLKIAIGTHNYQNKEFVDNFVSSVQNCGYHFSKYSLKAVSAMEKLLSFINNDVDAFMTANCVKDWDILSAIPILEAIGANYYTENATVYYNNNFNSGTFIVANNEDLLQDLITISKNIYTTVFNN